MELPTSNRLFNFENKLNDNDSCNDADDEAVYCTYYLNV